MIARLSHFIETEAGEAFVTVDGVVGFIVEVSLLEVESSRYHLESQGIVRWLKTLGPSILARFIYEQKRAATPVNQTTRARAVAELGSNETKLRLSLEVHGELDLVSSMRGFLGLNQARTGAKIASLLSVLGALRSTATGLRVLSSAEMRAICFQRSKLVFREGTSFLDHGSHVQGCIRLSRQTPGEIDLRLLARKLALLSIPLRISTSVRRMSAVRREFVLRTRLKQNESGSDRIAAVKAEATENAIESTFLEGRELFEFEWIVSLEELSVERLRERLSEVRECLADLGDLEIETFGCLPSLAASYPGVSQHVPLLEEEEALLAYLPIGTFGDPMSGAGAPDRAFIVHRENQSATAVDILAGLHMNANALVIGSSGRGKSVFTGLFTASLLEDPQVKVIKVDVGGSHTKECELFGGKEYLMSLESSSGLNPFGLIGSSEATEAHRAILGKFIEVLVLADGETAVPKEIRAEIDEVLQCYLKENGRRSLRGFNEASTSFSRRKLLSRWCGEGLYGKAFSEAADQVAVSNQLTYYNFSRIFEAADPDFAQAGMAAVLAQFNLELLMNPGQRIVLICDEVPFFIDRCFEFFKFSMANVRKFGASLVLVVQLSKHLIKNGDTGLFENSHHRFLFSADGDLSEFAARFRLPEPAMDALSVLRFIPGKRSEVLYQFGEETRKLNIQLTPEEYWRVTSSQSDRLKLARLMEHVPDLSLHQAILVLSASDQ